MEDWPPVDHPSSNISYDKSHKQLIYLGHMTANEKASILSKLEDAKHRRAVEISFSNASLGHLKI